jgi:hypothetical protein
MKAALPLHLYTEKDWDHQLKQLCDRLGWTLNYHTLRSKGSRSGFPDRILVRERLIAVELKTETGKPTDMQAEWLDGLSAAGVETYLWRPSDLEEAGQVLSKRWRYEHADASLVGTSTSTLDRLWPRSIWLTHIGRRDYQRTITAA